MLVHNQDIINSKDNTERHSRTTIPQASHNNNSNSNRHFRRDERRRIQLRVRKVLILPSGE